MSVELQRCYFCETMCYPQSYFIQKYNDIWICMHCEFSGFSHIIDNNECPICYENKKCIMLPFCHHIICIDCCKQIYFGISSEQIPVQYNEVEIDDPIWPYEKIEKDIDGNSIEDKKETIYNDFTYEHLLNSNNETYDEMITIRNSLISARPQWMNTDEFIDYENHILKYYNEYNIIDKTWKKYNDNKSKGNQTCPLCRHKPNMLFE